MGMNGGTGFHHKAVKSEPAGGHFNASVNMARARLCRLSKHFVADALKGDAAFWKSPAGFSEHVLMVPTGLGRPSLILSRASKVTMRGNIKEGVTRE